MADIDVTWPICGRYNRESNVLRILQYGQEAIGKMTIKILNKSQMKFEVLR